MLELACTRDDEGLRPDRALRQRLTSLDRDAALALLKRGRILVNGVPASLRTALSDGDVLSLDGEPAAPPRAALHFLDEDLLVLGKPSGMAVHPAAGVEGETLLDIARAFLDGKKVPYAALAPAGRLDRGTSGPVAFALTARCHQVLGRAFQDGEVGKEYLALVEGQTPDAFTIDAPIPSNGALRDALTHFTRLAFSSRATLLSAAPSTGRKHQIRRHLADAGHPIVGDARYGGASASRMMLHARLLELPHPTHRAVRIAAPAEPDFLDVMRAFSVSPDALETRASGTKKTQRTQGT